MPEPSIFDDSLHPSSSNHDSGANSLFTGHPRKNLINRKLLKLSPLILVLVASVSAIAFNTYLFGLRDKATESTPSFQVNLEKLAASEQKDGTEWHFGLTSAEDAYAGLLIRSGDEVPRVISMKIKLQAGIRTLATDQNDQLYKYSFSKGDLPTRICAFAASSTAQLHLLVNQISGLLQKLPHSACLDF